MKYLLGAVLTCLAVAGAKAGHVLYDFERDWQFEEWETGQAESQEFFPSTKFASSGKRSIGFKAEASDHKAKLKVLVWDNDWAPYEFVSFVLTNPTTRRQVFKGFIGDGNGYTFWVAAPPMSSQEYIYRIRFPKFARKNNILDFSLEAELTGEAEFYLDELRLLKKDEDPALQAKDRKKRKKRNDYRRPVPTLQAQLKNMKKELVAKHTAAISGYMDDLNLGLPAAKAAILAEAKALRKRIQATNLTDSDALEIVRDAERLQMTADRFKQLLGYAKQYKGDRDAGFIVGFTDATVNVMPKHIKNELRIAPDVSLSLARNEKEAVQVIVAPLTRDAKQVSVTVTDLEGQGGRIPAKQVDVDLLAYAKVPKPTSSDVTYMGWYPDALIRNPKPVDVKMGDQQGWWVRVRAKDQKPGLYRGTITVKSSDAKPQTFGLNVKIYDFNLPIHAPVPTAITYGVDENQAKKRKILGGVERWNKKLKYVHADFLADYLISYDNLYHGKSKDKGTKPSVDWELIKYLRDKGTLGPINFGLFYDSKDSSVAEYRHNYKAAKKLGVLDKCYIYGFDEQPRSSYGNIEAASKKFRKLYPEVLVMTTAQDHSYGFDSPMKTLSAWCPIISRFNPTLAEKAREHGRRVWWYTCCWPKHPYPNVYVDYPAVDNRVLLGWMYAKYKPDGYLYFHMSIYTKEDWATGITEYPYTNWHPYNFMSCNGDGSMTCIDSKGYPVATIRLENYRDGLEDLAYYMILEHKVKLAKDTHPAWTKKAKAALADVDKLVRTRYDYVLNGKKIYDYRNQLAALIESSPVKDDNPWKKGLSVWGLNGLPKERSLSAR